MRSETVTVRTGFLAAVRRSSRPASFLAVLIGLAFFSVATALPASASGLLLFNQTFENNTVPTSQVVLPDLPTGAAQSYPSQACLTAGGTPSGASSVPQCSGASDPNGSGYLRFTDTGGAEEGGVFSATSLPATQGLDVQFNSYQFGGSGADGIAFALAIANPTDPEPPAKIGDSGGSLGYGPCVECEGGDNGLSYGYLGIGLDAYGNFSSTIPDGSDCSGQGDTAPGATPEAVSVRGPGNGEDGYCMVGGPWAEGSLRASTSTAVPVEVAINPTVSTITTASGMSVSSDSYGVRWTPVGGTQQTETGALPNLNRFQVLGPRNPFELLQLVGGPLPDDFRLGRLHRWIDRLPRDPRDRGRQRDGHPSSHVLSSGERQPKRRVRPGFDGRLHLHAEPG